MVCLLIALNRRRDVMRIVSTASVMLLLSGFTWAQSDEVEQLKQLVEQQKNEIEDLKVRLARIENLLGTNTMLSVQPVTYSPRPQAETNQAPPVAPSLAGIRLSGELRMRFESTTRGSLQTERNSSNPAASFFVPLGRETPRTWRFATQLGFSF
jgi:hypothetical protein